MLYTIKSFASHRLGQTADMPDTGLIINLPLLQTDRITNKTKLTGGWQRQRQQTICISSPFELPLSPPPAAPQAGTARSGTPNPSRAPGTRLAALFRHQGSAHLCAGGSLRAGAGASSSHECPTPPGPQDKPLTRRTSP